MIIFDMKSKINNIINFTNDYQNKEEIILRNHLANERTLLSCIRTLLYLV